MYILDKDKARSLLLTKDSNPIVIETFLDNFPPLDDSLGQLVDQWLDDQQIPDLVIDGISLKHLMSFRASNFLKAIRDLNKLLDPSLSEADRQQWIRILNTPRFYE